jgi:hypothetical protein
MKLTVTGTIGNFKAGQVLKRDKDAIAYYRTILDDGVDVPSPLDDDTILDAINAVEGDDEESEQKRITLMEAGGVVDVFHDVAITAGSNPIAQHASKLAAKISAATFADVEIFIAAKKAVKRGPAVVALGLSRDFTQEDIEGMPEAGSTSQQTNNPDRFSDIIGGKKVPASFYAKLFDSSALGAPILLKLNGMDKALKSPPDADAPVEYKRMTKSEKTAERANLSQARTDGRGNLVTAVKLLKKMARINRMENCGARFFYEDAKAEHKTIKNSPACMIVYDKHEPANVSVLTVGGFNALKPDTIAGNAKLADLLETSSKPPKPAVATGVPANYDLDVYIANTGLMVGYIEKLRADEKLMGNFYARLNTVAGQDFLANVFRLEEFLDTVTSKDELKKAYTKQEAALAAGGKAA